MGTTHGDLLVPTRTAPDAGDRDKLPSAARRAPTCTVSRSATASSCEVGRLLRPPSESLVWGVAAGFVVLAIAAQLPIFDRNFVSMDEGHLVLTASRLLDGELLYRDIHTGIFPGIYLATAGLLGLFGEEVLVTRIAQIAGNVATLLLLWLIGLRIVPPRWAALPPLLFIALIWISFPVLTMFNYSALAGALGLAALLATLRYLERGRSADALAIGVVVGACLFTKQNYGALAALALAAAIALGQRHSALRDRSLQRALLPVVLSGSAFLVLAIGWLAASGSLSAWLDSTLLSLVGSQLQDFDNPIPPILGSHPSGDPRFVYLYIPSSLFDYLVRGDRFLGMALEPGRIEAVIRLFYGLPIAALIAAPAWLAWRPAKRQAETTAVVLFAVIFFFGIFPSAVFSHLVYVLAPILLLFSWLGFRIEELLAGSAARIWAATAWATVLFAIAVCSTIPAHVRQTYSSPSGLPHVGIRVSADQAQIHAAALQFIHACARPGEPIFTLPILPILYLSSGHPNPVKWDLLIPGAIDQKAIVQTLEEQSVRCVVRQRDMNPEFPPLAVLYPVLDTYLATHYRKARPLVGGGQLWHGLVRTAPFESQP